jgi:hypothetical protein
LTSSLFLFYWTCVFYLDQHFHQRSDRRTWSFYTVTPTIVVWRYGLIYFLKYFLNWVSLGRNFKFIFFYNFNILMLKIKKIWKNIFLCLIKKTPYTTALQTLSKISTHSVLIVGCS